MSDNRQSSRDVIRRLQKRIRAALASYNPVRTEYALLDFPDYANVGDSAIWLGQIAHFRRAWHNAPAYVSDITGIDWNALDVAVPHGPVFISGGGNFGDLWPDHQAFREEVLDRYQGRPVVQLPQSIHYDRSAAADRTARAIARHGDFTLMVRDQESLEFAQKHFDCQVQLVPDLAFSMGPLRRVGRPVFETMMLLRTDKESTREGQSEVAARDDILTADWVDDDSNLDREASRHVRRTALLNWQILRSRANNARTYAWFEGLARARVKRGLSLLSQGQRIVTDRLHAHILATLMNIDHVLLDNSYGKIRRFADTWDTRWGGVSVAENIEDALRQLSNGIRHGMTSRDSRTVPSDW